MEDLVAMPKPSFWRGRKVLLTGHTGFKGGWLGQWLRRLGADVAGLALPPTGQPNLFDSAQLAGVLDSHLCDLRDANRVSGIVETTRPEVIFHLAAQPLVRRSYREPIYTFETNVMGTANLLEAVRAARSASVVVVVTSDKVYRNDTAPSTPFREADALGGHDPYSASKAACEIVAASYRDAFLRDEGTAVATARAGNVIGGGDWAEDRLVPDAIRAWQAGATLRVRKPDASRPWQHVLDPLRGYLILAEKLAASPELAGPYNFGPESGDIATVRKVVDLALSVYGKGEVLYGPSDNDPRESDWLMLDSTKACAELGIEPVWPLKTAIGRTIRWYREFAAGTSARELCDADIDDYEAGR